MGYIFSKIHVKYEIYDPPSMIYPNDTLLGKVILQNIGNTEKKLKKVFIKLVSKYEHFQLTSTSERSGGEEWLKNTERLHKYQLKHPQFIKAGEIIEIEFVIQLPSKWKQRIGSDYRLWHLALLFLQKTRLKSSFGAKKEDAICVLPVEHSEIPPSRIFLQKIESGAIISQRSQMQSGLTICPNCGMENDNTAKFCTSCGIKLLLIKLCPLCGKEINKENNYCKHCGTFQEKTLTRHSNLNTFDKEVKT